jgi:hypothetical protein
MSWRLRLVRNSVGLGVVATLFGCLLVIGSSSAPASASAALPTPQHLIVGSPITIPTALFEANKPGAYVLVTPTQSRQVAAAMWQAWEPAMVESDTRALTQLMVPGQVLEGTLDNCAFPDGRCVNETHSRQVRSLTTVVPVQRTYPIYFLAEIQTSELVANSQNLDTWQPWLEIQILTKASPTSSWMLSFDSGYNAANGGTPNLIPFDQGGPSAPNEPNAAVGIYNTFTAHPAPPYPATQYLSLLSGYWQSYVDTGHAPAPSAFISDGDTSGFGEQMAQSPQGYSYAGHQEDKSFATEPSYPSWSFTASGGYPVVCGSVVDTATDFTSGTNYLNQNADETNFGIPLRAGEYSQIVSETAHDTCVYPAQGGLDAAGNSTYTYAVTGTLLHQAPPQVGSSTLSDLENAYAVLANELVQYQKNLKTCQQDGGSSCLNVVNNQISGEFGLFANRLMSYMFSSREKPTVDSLYATSVNLGRLFEDAQTKPGNLGKDSSQINAQAARFLQESETLIKQLSGVPGKNA